MATWRPPLNTTDALIKQLPRCVTQCTQGMCRERAGTCTPKDPIHPRHVPGERRHLHGDAEALVQSADAAMLVGAHNAVHEALELAVSAALAKIGAQPRPRKVQRVHNQQRPYASQAACMHAGNS